MPEEPKYPDEPIQREIEKETFTLTAENYNLSVTAGFLREDLNDSGKAYVLGLSGQINGQNINFNYEYETPLYTNYPEIYSVFPITTGEGQTLPYNIHLVYDNDGLHVKSLKRADIMENVKIHIGNQTITQDFLREDRYYFTNEQLPKGDWGYRCIAYNNAGIIELPYIYAEDGRYYLTIQDCYEYTIVRLNVGECTYHFTDENYDITLVLEIRITDSGYYKIYQKSVSGEIDGYHFDIQTDGDVFDCDLWLETNAGTGNIVFYYYAEGFDLKIGVLGAMFL